MILADSSAWIEFLRRTGSTADLRVDKLVRTGELVTTDAVVMEILAGARNVAHRRSLAGLLARFRFEPTEGPGDYEAAADVYEAAAVPARQFARSSIASSPAWRCALGWSCSTLTATSRPSPGTSL